MGDSKKYRKYKAGINIVIYVWRKNLQQLPTIIPMNYLIKGWKYLMFEDKGKVDYLIDKLRINIILFIYYILSFFLSFFLLFFILILFFPAVF